MGALGFVPACMAIWHTSTLQEFGVGAILPVQIQVLLCFISVRVTSICILMVGLSGIGLMLMDFEALRRLCSLRSVTSELWTEVRS
jgi:hypothetical protein